nr:hypothetical protein [Candidatus Sigynarchaeota archaeon]
MGNKASIGGLIYSGIKLAKAIKDERDKAREREERAIDSSYFTPELNEAAENLTGTPVQNLKSKMIKAKRFNVDGKEIDLTTDLLFGNLDFLPERWYTGPRAGFLDHFVRESIQPRLEIFGPKTTLVEIQAMLQDLINVMYGFDDALGSNLSMKKCLIELVERNIIDLNLNQLPYLTDKGLALRVMALEIHPDYLDAVRLIDTRSTTSHDI